MTQTQSEQKWGQTSKKIATERYGGPQQISLMPEFKFEEKQYQVTKRENQQNLKNMLRRKSIIL